MSIAASPFTIAASLRKKTPLAPRVVEMWNRVKNYTGSSRSRGLQNTLDALHISSGTNAVHWAIMRNGNHSGNKHTMDDKAFMEWTHIGLYGSGFPEKIIFIGLSWWWEVRGVFSHMCKFQTYKDTLVDLLVVLAGVRFFNIKRSRENISSSFPVIFIKDMEAMSDIKYNRFKIWMQCWTLV